MLWRATKCDGDGSGDNGQLISHIVMIHMNFWTLLLLWVLMWISLSRDLKSSHPLWVCEQYCVRYGFNVEQVWFVKGKQDVYIFQEMYIFK